MEEKCRIDFEGEDLEKDSFSGKDEEDEEPKRPGSDEIMNARFGLFEAAALRSWTTSPFFHLSSALPYPVFPHSSFYETMKTSHCTKVQNAQESRCK